MFLLFIDYVRSMAHASSWQTYVSELVKTRYTNGMIDFTGRKHFFHGLGGHISAKCTRCYSGHQPVYYYCQQTAKPKE
uniref:Inner membrane protein n=1 Tax=Klebsiella pneumoniae TaxID=573 RepID=A0A8B0SVE9_KLEPN|nr:Putative inner membrane protein [Klebsiella pneumoniae]